MQQLAAGKDIAFDEITDAGTQLRVARAAGGDAVVQQQPAGFEQAADLVEVTRQHRPADMLEHAHRGDLVEGRVLGKMSIVEQLHLHPSAQPALFDQLVDEGVLVLRQRDAGGVHTMVFGRPQQQRAPAGTDVQETLAGAQHQLPADVLQLGLLGLGQRQIFLAEVGTRIDALRIQPQGIEVVGHVVVELHLARIGFGAVPRQ